MVSDPTKQPEIRYFGNRAELLKKNQIRIRPNFPDPKPCQTAGLDEIIRNGNNFLSTISNPFLPIIMNVFPASADWLGLARVWRPDVSGFSRGSKPDSIFLLNVEYTLITPRIRNFGSNPYFRDNFFAQRDFFRNIMYFLSFFFFTTKKVYSL